MILLILDRTRWSHKAIWKKIREQVQWMQYMQPHPLLCCWKVIRYDEDGVVQEHREERIAVTFRTLVYPAMSGFLAELLMFTLTGLVKVTFKLLYRYWLVDAIYLCTIVNCPAQLKQNKKPECISKYLKQTPSRVFTHVLSFAIMSHCRQG